jgi:hypothetical protein
MMKSAIVGAAAIFASALATPAMAQPVITDPGKCAQYYPNANCQNLGAGNPYTGSYQRRAFAAFDNGYPGGYYGQTYAQRNGFVCTPGTWYRGDDGRRHLCR